MQLSLLDDPCDTRRIGFLAASWDGERLAILLTQIPGEQSDNP